MTLSPFNNKVYISNHSGKRRRFGEVKFAENYGWKSWGGTNYSMTKCGEVQKGIKIYQSFYILVPSIGQCSTNLAKVLNLRNGTLMTSLRNQSLRS